MFNIAIDLQLDDSIDFKLYTEHLSYELHSSVTYIRKGRNYYSANPSPFSVVPHVSALFPSVLANYKP